MIEAAVAAIASLVAILTELAAAISAAMFLLLELLVEAVVSLWSFFQRRSVSRAWKLVVGTAIILVTVGTIAFLLSSGDTARAIPPELSPRPGECGRDRLAISVRLGKTAGQDTSPAESASPAETGREADVPDGQAVSVPPDEGRDESGPTRSRVGQLLKGAVDRFTRRQEHDEVEPKPVK